MATALRKVWPGRPGIYVFATERLPERADEAGL